MKAPGNLNGSRRLTTVVEDIFARLRSPLDALLVVYRALRIAPYAESLSADP